MAEAAEARARALACEKRAQTYEAEVKRLVSARLAEVANAAAVDACPWLQTAALAAVQLAQSPARDAGEDAAGAPRIARADSALPATGVEAAAGAGAATVVAAPRPSVSRLPSTGIAWAAIAGGGAGAGTSTGTGTISQGSSASGAAGARARACLGASFWPAAGCGAASHTSALLSLQGEDGGAIAMPAGVVEASGKPDAVTGGRCPRGRWLWRADCHVRDTSDTADTAIASWPDAN